MATVRELIKREDSPVRRHSFKADGIREEIEDQR